MWFSHALTIWRAKRGNFNLHSSWVVRMIAAPQRSHSPYCPSPLSFSLLLGEQKAALQEQTVPISPSLSPLAVQQKSKTRNSIIPQDVLVRTTRNRQSPSPALVPDCGERTFSGSPLLRQILTGHKRQRDISPDDAKGSPATPSPIATNSKRFCQHCSNVYSETNNHLVVLSRKKASSKKPTSLEQVVPSSGLASAGEVEGNSCPPLEKDPPKYKKGIKMFDLFIGDDIFAHHDD